jgi:LacI family transcriptional regulator
VAKLAGLSTSSVSRALTGARPVQPDIAERVAQAARQLGYRPNAVARSLRRQETKILGLIVADITNPFFPELVQAVERQARDAGYGLLLVDAQNDAEIEKESIKLLLDMRIDVLLISASHRFLSRAVIDAAAELVPVLQLDRVVDEAKGFVRVDQQFAVTQLIDHMVLEGHAHLAFIGSDPSVSTSWERQQAFLSVAPLRDAGAAGRVLVGDFSVDWGREAARKILSLWPEVDGVICANDLIAFGALQEFSASGVSIPNDMAISGFDDTLIGQASQLTSIRQPVAEMGAVVVRYAIELVNSEIEPPHVTLTPELVVRGSTSNTFATP